MINIIVAGLETAVGANLATGLGTVAAVTGVVLSGAPVTVPNCRGELPADNSVAGLQRWLVQQQAGRVVLCGPGATSGWDDARRPSAAEAHVCRQWIEATAAAGIPLTLISSDAVFTGPWMFHAECSNSWCPSPEATLLRQLESCAAEANPENLILRTHAFGWTPGAGQGWLERVLASLAAGDAVALDCVRYASPILASDLCQPLLKAWEGGLKGCYHLAGAERVNPVAFVRKLANEFALPLPRVTPVESLISRVQGYGCGETSLQTRQFRQTLGVSLPLVGEGLRRLYQQHVEGYRGDLQQVEHSRRAA